MHSKRLVVHGVNFLRHLEVQLQCHLDQPGGAEADDLSERPAGDAAGGIVPVAVIQDVEEVGTELQLQRSVNWKRRLTAMSKFLWPGP